MHFKQKSFIELDMLSFYFIYFNSYICMSRYKSSGSDFWFDSKFDFLRRSRPRGWRERELGEREMWRADLGDQDLLQHLTLLISFTSTPVLGNVKFIMKERDLWWTDIRDQIFIIISQFARNDVSWSYIIFDTCRVASTTSQFGHSW